MELITDLKAIRREIGKENVSGGKRNGSSRYGSRPVSPVEPGF